MEIRKEKKSIGSNEKYFHIVVTPNREKPKVQIFLVCFVVTSSNPVFVKLLLKTLRCISYL